MGVVDCLRFFVFAHAIFMLVFFVVYECANMNSLVVHKIETAILENAEITKLYGDGKYCSWLVLLKRPPRAECFQQSAK